MSKDTWITLIVVLIAYQAYATVLVLRSDDFDDDVKLKLVVTIWLIPIVGAVLVRMRLNIAKRARLLKQYEDSERSS